MASDSGPAQPVGLVRKAAAVAASRGCCRVAVRDAAHGRPDTPARGHAGRGKCHALATCVRDRARAAAPAGKRGNNSAPGCGPTWAAPHDTRVGRTRASAKKFLLRDHAPPQPLDPSAPAAKVGHADGAHVLPRRARFWPPPPDAVGLAAAPLANALPDAGMRGPGSNAGSNAAAGTSAHNPCAGRSVLAVVANSDSGGRWAYHGNSPRESSSPKGQPEESAFTFSSGASPDRYAVVCQSILPCRNQTAKETV